MLKQTINSKNTEFVFSGEFKNLEKIRKLIKLHALNSGFSDDDSDKLALAVDEACTNLIRYSFNFDDKQKIKIIILKDDKYFIIQIFDLGKPFNLLEVPKPNMKEYLLSYKKGGLGIYLIRSVMDEIDYIPSNDINPQNTLILKKLLA